MRNKILFALFLACSFTNLPAETPRCFWPKVFPPADAIVAQLDTCGPEIFADKKPLIDKLYLFAQQLPGKPALLWRAKFWDARLRRNTDHNYDSCIKLINEAYLLVKKDTTSYDYHRILLVKNFHEFRQNKDYYRYYVFANKELDYYSSIGDELRSADCYTKIGIVYNELGISIQALKNYEKSYEISKKYGYLWTYSHRHNIAFCKYKLGQKVEAINMLKDIEKEYKNGPNKNFYINILTNLCSFLSDRPDKEDEYNKYSKQLIESLELCSDDFIKH